MPKVYRRVPILVVGREEFGRIQRAPAGAHERLVAGAAGVPPVCRLRCKQSVEQGLEQLGGGSRHRTH